MDCSKHLQPMIEAVTVQFDPMEHRAFIMLRQYFIGGTPELDFRDFCRPMVEGCT